MGNKTPSHIVQIYKTGIDFFNNKEYQKSKSYLYEYCIWFLDRNEKEGAYKHEMKAYQDCIDGLSDIQNFQALGNEF